MSDDGPHKCECSYVSRLYCLFTEDDYEYELNYDKWEPLWETEHPVQLLKMLALLSSLTADNSCSTQSTILQESVCKQNNRYSIHSRRPQKGVIFVEMTETVTDMNYMTLFSSQEV